MREFARSDSTVSTYLHVGGVLMPIVGPVGSFIAPAFLLAAAPALPPCSPPPFRRVFFLRFTKLGFRAHHRAVIVVIVIVRHHHRLSLTSLSLSRLCRRNPSSPPPSFQEIPCLRSPLPTSNTLHPSPSPLSCVMRRQRDADNLDT